MNKFKKSVGIVVVVALSIAAFVVGFFGITTQYGDTEKVVIQSPDYVAYDLDLGETTEMVFSLTDTSVEITAEDMDLIKTVMSKRLEFLKVTNYQIHCDYYNNKISVKVPSQTSISISFLATYLGAVGDIYVRSGNTVSNAYIFTADDVRSVNLGTDSLGGLYTSYTFDIDLNSKGRDALRRATEALVDAYGKNQEAGYVTLWFNNEQVLSTQITDKSISNGKLSFTSYNIDEETAVAIGMFLGGGELPYQLSYSMVKIESADLGEEPVSTIGLAMLAAVAAIFIFLIIRYGIFGFIGLISALGTAGVMMFFITGFFYGSGYTGALATLGAFFLVLFVCIETTIRDASTIKGLMKESFFERAVTLGLKTTRWQTLKIYITIFVFSIVMLLCGRNGVIASLLRLIGLPSYGILSIGVFGSVMLAGLFAATIFSFFGSRMMIRSITSMVKKPELYGGGKDA